MRAAALSLIALLAAGSARAQFAQYTAPGSLAAEQIPTKERIEAAMEDARYHIGPLMVGPWFALKDLAYLNNVYATSTGQKSDITATLGVGAQAYLPVATRLTLGMYAMPEYVWWHDLSSRRGWNGAVGVGLFGYFNRMTLEVQAGGSRVQQFPSSEVEVPVNLEDRRVSALVEVRVAGKLSLFGRGGVDRWRYNQRGLGSELADSLALLDRDEKHAGAGVRFHFTKAISLGLGVERYTTDFVHSERERSNSGPAPVAELDLTSGRLSLTVNAIALDLKPSNSSQFVSYSGTNGSFRVGFRPAGKLTLAYYGGRNLTYSIDPAAPYYLDERTGFAAESPVGWRAIGRVFVEIGHDRYVTGVSGTVGRSDDLKAYGVTCSMQLGRRATLVVGGSRTDFSSAVAGYNRSVTQVQTSVQFASGKTQWW